jgi:hypothetical protein
VIDTATTVSLRRIERGARAQPEISSVTNDALERMMLRLVKLERAAGVVEGPEGAKG